MSLIKKEFVASNGHKLEYFQSENFSDKKAHVFWFSAFTRGPLLGRILKTEQRFHGFKAAKSFQDFSFTLLRDDSGLTGDGTYYYGKANNPYIEVAISELISSIKTEVNQTNSKSQFIGVGSSMGAYAATKFGILNSFNSVLALVPHFNLEAAAKYCGRKRWIDWAIDNASEEDAEKYLYRLQTVVVENRANLPTLFLQSAMDDPGVHKEQVIPFIELYGDSGGVVFADLRKSGGHSMVNASNDFIHSALELLVNNEVFERGMFDHFPLREETRAEKLERHFARVENQIGKILKK